MLKKGLAYNISYGEDNPSKMDKDIQAWEDHGDFKYSTWVRPAEGVTYFEHCMSLYEKRIQKFVEEKADIQRIAECKAEKDAMYWLSKDTYYFELDDNDKISKIIVYRNGFFPFWTDGQFHGPGSAFSNSWIDALYIVKTGYNLIIAAGEFLFESLGLNPVDANPAYFKPQYAILEDFLKDFPEFGIEAGSVYNPKVKNRAIMLDADTEEDNGWMALYNKMNDHDAYEPQQKFNAEKIKTWKEKEALSTKSE